jgi:hypothetical protein
MVDYGAPLRPRRQQCAARASRQQVFDDAHPHAASAPLRLASPAHAGTDQLLLDIADYVVGYELQSAEALQTARYSLLDSLSASRPHPLRVAQPTLALARHALRALR